MSRRFTPRMSGSLRTSPPRKPVTSVSRKGKYELSFGEHARRSIDCRRTAIPGKSLIFELRLAGREPKGPKNIYREPLPAVNLRRWTPPPPARVRLGEAGRPSSSTAAPAPPPITSGPDTETNRGLHTESPPWPPGRFASSSHHSEGGMPIFPRYLSIDKAREGTPAHAVGGQPTLACSAAGPLRLPPGNTL